MTLSERKKRIVVKALGETIFEALSVEIEAWLQDRSYDEKSVRSAARDYARLHILEAVQRQGSLKETLRSLLDIDTLEEQQQQLKSDQEDLKSSVESLEFEVRNTSWTL